MRARAFRKVQCCKLQCLGFRVWAEHPRGAWSIEFLAMNRVGHVLRVNLQDV